MVYGSSRAFSPRHLAFLSAFFGIFSFLGALGWEHIGAAMPCIFCRIERLFFLGAGLVSVLALLFSGLGVQRFLAVASCAWACVSVVILRHLGVQWRWFSVPEICRTPTDKLSGLDLMNVPFVRCDRIEFLLFGFPPTFYMLLMTGALFILCAWGFTLPTRRR